jgi:hypothetical protein
MFKVTSTESTQIRKDWADALANVMLDQEYCELEDSERTLWLIRDPVFLTKFRKDVKEFLETIVEFRQRQADKLFKHDPQCFDYLKQDFVEFAKYGGTECRLVYRTFFARKGYNSFVGWLDTKSMDAQPVKFINEIYTELYTSKVEETA